MQSFNVSSALSRITNPYPSLDEIAQVVHLDNRDARYALARLWLSEGIPYAFKSNPAIYEALRLWLARNIGVEPKEITLIGSARQGYSLSPDITLGRAFGPQSDLDLSAVSPVLFERIKQAYMRWQDDYTNGSAQPRHEREKHFWDENARTCPVALSHGFIDPHKIPTWSRYPEAQTILSTLWRGLQKLRATNGAPIVRKLSLRVYSNWDSFVRQVAINLEATVSFYRQRTGS
jgi:hypothetical protein